MPSVGSKRSRDTELEVVVDGAMWEGAGEASVERSKVRRVDVGTGTETEPVPDSRRRRACVTFSPSAKEHDGLHPTHAVLDQLMWDFSQDPRGTQWCRAYVSSTYACDCPVLLAGIHGLLQDVLTRVRSAVDEAEAALEHGDSTNSLVFDVLASGEDCDTVPRTVTEAHELVSVAVLPGGGGRGLRVRGTHVPLVEALLWLTEPLSSSSESAEHHGELGEGEGEGEEEEEECASETSSEEDAKASPETPVAADRPSPRSNPIVQFGAFGQETEDDKDHAIRVAIASACASAASSTSRAISTSDDAELPILSLHDMEETHGTEDEDLFEFPTGDAEPSRTATPRPRRADPFDVTSALDFLMGSHGQEQQG